MTSQKWTLLTRAHQGFRGIDKVGTHTETRSISDWAHRFSDFELVMKTEAEQTGLLVKKVLSFAQTQEVE